MVVTPLAKGVWDLRVGNNNGGPVIEFADHLVLFEANGSAAATLARIDAANKLVAGKRVTQLIVTHHHFDHTAGLRAAVSRGLAVIAHRGNETDLSRDDLAAGRRVPRRPGAQPASARYSRPSTNSWCCRTQTQRLEIYHVLGHSHMANAVFAYVPAARIMMEGDLGDAEWTWHWWAERARCESRAPTASIRVLNVAVHGPNGGLTIAADAREQPAAGRGCGEVLRRAAGGRNAGIRVPRPVRRIRPAALPAR